MLGRMKKIEDIYTFEDDALHQKMLRISLAALVAGGLAALAWFAASRLLNPDAAAFELGRMALADGGGAEGGGSPGDGAGGLWVWALALAAGCLVPLPVHELVHGALFKLFAPAGSRVTFGVNLRAGMIYACAQGVVYTRAQYIAIALAPAVVVTGALLAVGAALGWPLWGIVVASVHLCGCSGDIAYVDIIRRNPLITHCEDTSFGVSLYGADSEEEE